MKGDEAPDLRLLRWDKVSFISPRPGEVPLLFAVDAAAVGLSVHSGLLGNPNPFVPAFPEITIEERDALFSGRRLGFLSDKIVLLIAAVKESGGESVKPALFCGLRCLGNPEHVTLTAPLFFLEGHLLQERFEGIVVIPDDCEALLRGESGQGVEPFLIFQIGVNVGVEEKPKNLVSLFTEQPQWEDRARGAADMQ
jgi:hypothetical protein